MSERTPGEWKLVDRTIYALNIEGVNRFSALVQGGRDDDRNRTSNEELAANAEFIVRACNAHDDLLDACETGLKYIEAVCFNSQPGKKRNNYADAAAILRAAIAKAKGEA